MSASINEDVSSPLSDAQSVLDQTISKSSSHDSLENCSKISPIEAGRSNGDAAVSEPTTPKPNPMAFTIDFGDSRKIDRNKLEELAKKSQARHQRVQSMSGSLTKPSPVIQKPPMSAKLPRKTQGYNSEGYFSSDQEDSCLSGSVKIRQSPLAQHCERTHITSPITNRHLKSPINDSFTLKRTSKSPIVDSIMSRSDILPSRQALNLPLKNPNSFYLRDVHRTPSYGNLSSSYQQRSTMADIIDQSPEAVMLADISSPEFDMLTPDNDLSTPDAPKSPSFMKGRRAVSETPDLLFKKCPANAQPLYIDDDIDRQSNNSSTGTYTIETDTYTEEQRARMSIDRTLGTEISSKTVNDLFISRGTSSERDPELIYDHARFIHEIPTKDVKQRSALVQCNMFDCSSKQSRDKNVLEISCSYDSPTEHDLAAQTSKQIKSTRNYLEKIKNRVRTITEKSLQKPHKDEDVGNFTSVTTSGVLSTKCPLKITENHNHRRCSLSKSEIDQTDYVHRLSRESSVPVSLQSNKLPLEEGRFESTALRNAHKAVRDDSGVSSDIASEQVVGKLSYLSLNRCKGDKTWIQEWADSVKKYNNHTLAEHQKGLNDTFTMEDEIPAMSPRRETASKYAPQRTLYSGGGTPSKIPSPVGSVHLRLTPDLIPFAHDTEAYLQKTQCAITNLQAKLRSSHTSIPPALTTSVMSDKQAASHIPVPTLSRSNSLNYRLKSKGTSADNSPLRSPANYVITGSGKPPEGRLLANTVSRSLEAERRRDSNMNSPTSDRGLHSNSSDDKTLSNAHPLRTHLRHRSFDGRTDFDVSNANSNVCLKTVLKNNAEAQNLYARIEQTRCLDDRKRGHQRVYNDGPDKPLKTLHGPSNVAFGSSIKRSSSFNTVAKNNNYMDANQRIVNARRASGNSDFNAGKDVVDYLSDESEGSFEKSQESRYKRPVARARIESPDLKSIAPANSPRLCPNTPEMQRKFGPGLVRNSVRVTNKERGLNTRLSEPPIAREERSKPANHQSRRISEPTRQAVLNRLTKSRSSTREFQPKIQEKGKKKPAQHRSSSALATKEAEFTNWKKRSSYDPMKAAQEDRKRRQQMASAKRLESNKDDLSSPSHSSPVHRSQSFHTTNIADLEALDYSSEEEELPFQLGKDNAMIRSTHSDILDLRRTEPRDARRQGINYDVLMTRDYVATQSHQPSDKTKRRLTDADKRKTYLLTDVTPTVNLTKADMTPTRETVDLGKTEALDKRKTFILDSDTNSTTNGSSPRNSSIFSHEKHSLTTGTSDTEGESGTESSPVVLRHPGGKRTTKEEVNPKHRYSGDYSMSSSTTSIAKKPIQPRYLDISKYKSDSSAKNFLRRDPSKTYVGVLNHGERAHYVSKGSAQQYEMEQKKQELEKWKRRASYDPRKSAAQATTRAKSAPKTASSVLRSQSFHGPMLTSSQQRYQPQTFITESYDASSDNDF